MHGLGGMKQSRGQHSQRDVMERNDRTRRADEERIIEAAPSTPVQPSMCAMRSCGFLFN
jgi:hypothetical protein